MQYGAPSSGPRPGYNAPPQYANMPVHYQPRACSCDRIVRVLKFVSRTTASARPTAILQGLRLLRQEEGALHWDQLPWHFIRFERLPQ